jgi:cysteine synthase
MSKIAMNLTGLIGNIPLSKLSSFDKKDDLAATLIVVKPEYFSAACSLKNRISLFMSDAARREKVFS